MYLATPKGVFLCRGDNGNGQRFLTGYIGASKGAA